MLADGKLDTKELNVHNLLMETNQFLIPSHQRDYSWTRDNITDFFSDIIAAKDSNQPEYFLGMMVFKQEQNSRLMVLDGQQRLATILIVLETLSAKLRELRQNRDSDRVHEGYITHCELGETVGRPKLVLNNNNNAKFFEYVINSKTQTDLSPVIDALNKYDSNRSLLDAIIACREKINELAAGKNQTEKAKSLLDFTKYLVNNIKIIRFTVPSLSSAYRVFETLNDRGLDLSIFDLIKNYLFDLADKEGHIADIEHTWTQLNTYLAQVSGEAFLKSYWASRYGLVRLPKLFDNLRKEVTNWNSADKISSDLFKAAEQYLGLEKADDPVWSNLPQSARNSVRALSILGAGQIHSILLSALDKMQTNQQEKLLSILEVFIVRYQLIGSGRTGALEVRSSEIAKKIYDGDYRTANDVKVALQDLYPSDTVFKAAFAEKQENQSSKIRYILYKLEMYARSTTEKSLGVELVPDNTLTIEHILPKNPKQIWKTLIDQDKDLYPQCLNRLGNICLLDKDINRSLGNSAFTKKKATFQKSNLILTKQVGTDYNTWDRKAIEKRQSEMAALAVETWKV